MTDMTTAWNAWAGYHRTNGFHVERFLNPPATAHSIRGLEEHIGFDLPEDLRALWSMANGQQDIFDIEDPSPGTVVSPLFGSQTFLSIEQAMRSHDLMREVHAENPEFDDDVVVRGTDPVHRAYWRPGWLPISEDGGGNAYAVDLSPTDGGTYGQIIVIGRDEDERRVLAPGLADWLADSAARRPELNDDADLPCAYFEIEPDRS